MNTNRKLLALAVMAALGGAGALPAQAALLNITSATAFEFAPDVTDSEGGPATTNNNASLGTSSVQQFDSSLGVLTGTTLNLAVTRSTTVTAAGDAETNNNQDKTSQGTGSSAVSISGAPGVTTFASGTQSLDGSCTGTKLAGCTATTTTTQTVTGAVDAADLDLYVGGTTVTGFTGTATTLSARHTHNKFPGGETTAHAVSATLAAEYSYLVHADASFGGPDELVLNLDFGDVVLGDTANLSFDVYNLLRATALNDPANQVGLTLESISYLSGDGDLFSFGALFSNLAADQSASVGVSWNTLGLAINGKSSSYQLALRDAGGAADSQWTYLLTMNLSGRVTDPSQVSAVPEPASLALLGVGLAGLAATTRRRRKP